MLVSGAVRVRWWCSCSCGVGEEVRQILYIHLYSVFLRLLALYFLLIYLHANARGQY